MKYTEGLQKLQAQNKEKLNFQAAIEAASEGLALREIARALGVSYSRLCSIMNNNASFSEAIRQGREMGFYLKAEQLNTILEDNPTEDVHRLRLKSDNLKWLLARLMPSVFGDRLEVKVEKVEVGAALIEARARVLRLGRDPADFNPAQQIEHAHVVGLPGTDSESVDGDPAMLDRFAPRAKMGASESANEQPLNPNTDRVERSETPSNPNPNPTGHEADTTIAPSRMLSSSPFD